MAWVLPTTAEDQTELSCILLELPFLPVMTGRVVGSLDAGLASAPATLQTTGPKDFQAPWSCAGVPVMSIPCGLGADGMPVGMQLVARHHHEPQLFAVARWCERVIEFRHVQGR